MSIYIYLSIDRSIYIYRLIYIYIYIGLTLDFGDAWAEQVVALSGVGVDVTVFLPRANNPFM